MVGTLGNIVGLAASLANPTQTTVLGPALAAPAAALHSPVALAAPSAALDSPAALARPSGLTLEPASAARAAAPIPLAATEPTANSGNGDRTIVVAPFFKLVFLTIVVITVLCGAADIAMAGVWSDPTSMQQSAFEAAGFAWKAGIGAILGLIGGKVA